MQTTTLEDLPPGTKLARVYPRGLPPEQCVYPEPYKWSTCVKPPIPFKYNGVAHYICEIVGATNIGIVSCDVKSLYNTVKIYWPYVTNIFWNHAGKTVYFPRLK